MFEYDVFLSSACEDEDIANVIQQELRQYGFHVFLSVSNWRVPVGQHWAEEIQRSLNNSQHYILICTSNSIQSDWIKLEYQKFFDQCYLPSNGKRQLFLIFAEGFDTNLLPPFLKNLAETHSVKEIIIALRSSELHKLGLHLKETQQKIKDFESERQTPISTTSNVPSQVRHSPQNNIFISYRRQDTRDITGRIYDRLIKQFKVDRVFYDKDSIPIGVDFRNYIDEMIGECGVLLAVIGTNWLDIKDKAGKRRIDNPADSVRLEIESSLRRRIPIIPILIHEANMPGEDDLPTTMKNISYIHALNVRSDPDFHKDVDRLIEVIEKLLKGSTPNI